MKICTHCVLPETFPGISFDDQGKCFFCRRYKGTENQEKLKKKYKDKFLDVLRKLNILDASGKRTESDAYAYDSIMAYSGGKDSTYTMHMLKETFGLNMLAITFDHGFVSPTTLENIRRVTDYLDIDHFSVHPGGETLCRVFRESITRDLYPIKALERASAICNSCMNLVKSFLLKTAIEMNIPLISYGWSPGQAPVHSSVFKTNPSMMRQTQDVANRTYQQMVGNRLSSFFLDDRHFESGNFPSFVHPLAFLDYDEAHILDTIKQMGWVDPKDTDENSSNCLLNGFANHVHLEHHGFHPYAFEIASLVREGYMTREAGLKKLSTPPDPTIVEVVRQKLGL